MSAPGSYWRKHFFIKNEIVPVPILAHILGGAGGRMPMGLTMDRFSGQMPAIGLTQTDSAVSCPVAQENNQE